MGRQHGIERMPLHTGATDTFTLPVSGSDQPLEVQRGDCWWGWAGADAWGGTGAVQGRLVDSCCGVQGCLLAWVYAWGRGRHSGNAGGVIDQPL